jgi:hypothetical protein
MFTLIRDYLAALLSNQQFTLAGVVWFVNSSANLADAKMRRDHLLTVSCAAHNVSEGWKSLQCSKLLHSNKNLRCSMCGYFLDARLEDCADCRQFFVMLERDGKETMDWSGA